MSKFMTILRYYHPSNESLIGDGSNVQILGWSPEQQGTGVDLDELTRPGDYIAKIAYVFGDTEEQMRNIEPRVVEQLGFTPDRCEREIYGRDCGAREIWFDEWADDFTLDDGVMVLWPKNEETEQLLLESSRYILEH